MIDGNDIWEALFGIMKGNVPEALTEDVLEQLATALRTPSPVLEVAKEALEKAATTFQHYAVLHRQKGTTDGDAKSDRNARLADAMDAALQTINEFEVD